ncbi:DUF2478 domain-containing protein [Stappia taiwanensis]|uniref:DUF2478 domain-containing protein n=1 Tax=Stappia taiwanensis TaxID=992267 RepID=A0A838XSG4_9HYPH|nr:DUF2478 domain-containing protein [Stappia taiwanensis]MBA4611598.1 DUF2478 domain-containing protein [Stappia taiwanensis]GGE98379.1 hypothetical protein GCM10007285_27420 [Stappia taiwanensis]
MTIAYIMAPGRGDTDQVLARFAAALVARGLNCHGVVQINTDRGEEHPCDMDVQVLPDGAVFRISQSLGPEARGCRLDPDALECAVAEVASGFDTSADILVLNKFGKHEADGRGFRDLIGEAVSHDIPVAVAVNSMNEAAFLEFASGLAVKVAPTVEALAAWFQTLGKGAAHDAPAGGTLAL